MQWFLFHWRWIKLPHWKHIFRRLQNNTTWWSWWKTDRKYLIQRTKSIQILWQFNQHDPRHHNDSWPISRRNGRWSHRIFLWLISSLVPGVPQQIVYKKIYRSLALISPIVLCRTGPEINPIRRSIGLFKTWWKRLNDLIYNRK